MCDAATNILGVEALLAGERMVLLLRKGAGNLESLISHFCILRNPRHFILTIHNNAVCATEQGIRAIA